jgi:FlaA1/EpsC-like NDP-sugar epimerase
MSDPMAKPFPLRQALVILLDFTAVLAAFTLSFLLRFDFQIPSLYQEILVRSLPLGLISYLPAFWFFRLYGGIYRYSSFDDLVRIVKAVAAGAGGAFGLILFVHHANYPRSILLLSPILVFLGICGIRFAIRLAKNAVGEVPGKGEQKTLIVGAGDMGESLLRMLRKSERQPYDIVGFIDDDGAKRHKHLHDVPVLGSSKDLPDLLERLAIEQVLIAITTRRGDVVRTVTEAVRLSGTKAEIKIAPSVTEMFDGSNARLPLRKVSPADLLNRKTVALDEASLARSFGGKVVLVSGAGGTIGSELCRQALRFGPAKVILLENHATSLFYREMELRERSRKTEVVAILGDAKDEALVDRIFDEHQPHIVLHAAAHKHVHQLQTNVQEGIQNNLLATYVMADAAHRHHAESFLLVSTDKAVRPANVMGATKRAAERVVQAFATESRTTFMAVRFGNVLGSSGSVLKIFQEQIAKGGPITITHPDMTRYFMTVEEAVQLILHSTTMATGGEVFILDMGQPVRILDMAKNLLMLNGLELDKDIKIEFIGPRSGEKIAEELVEDPDGVEQSAHPQIMRLSNGKISFPELEKQIRNITSLCHTNDETYVLRKLQELVPTFRLPEKAAVAKPLAKSKSPV